MMVHSRICRESAPSRKRRSSRFLGFHRRDHILGCAGHYRATAARRKAAEKPGCERRALGLRVALLLWFLQDTLCNKPLGVLPHPVRARIIWPISLDFFFQREESRNDVRVLFYKGPEIMREVALLEDRWMNHLMRDGIIGATGQCSLRLPSKVEYSLHRA